MSQLYGEERQVGVLNGAGGLTDMFARRNTYAICASETEVVLGHMVSGSQRSGEAVKILSSQSRGTGDEQALHRLFAGTGRRKGQVALVLPLSSFEIVSVTVPAVSSDAVSRLLPYSLSKVLDTPVAEYIYDWQVVQTFSDRQELTVFLYPLAMFRALQSELGVRQKEIVWFEADVFSACSFLESIGQIAADETVLCLLVWQNSISMAIYTQERITLVRSVDLAIPSTPYTKEPDALGPGAPENRATSVASGAEGEEDPGVMGTLPVEEDESARAVEVVDSFNDEDDLLAEFCLIQDNGAGESRAPVVRNSLESGHGQGGQEENEWQSYLRNLNLEIMRTNDYNVSVLKGKPFRNVFVGGAESFFQMLEQEVHQGLADLQVVRFPPQELEAECCQSLAALCIGALRR